MLECLPAGTDPVGSRGEGFDFELEGFLIIPFVFVESVDKIKWLIGY